MIETITKPSGESISFKMIHVKGIPAKLGENQELSVHTKDFWIAEFPVTQDLYEFIMGENPSRFKRARNPVEQVSWNDAQTFIKKLNDLTNKEYRLPSESEWEYAARGGIYWKDGFEYSGSNNLKEVAWCWDNSHRETKEVGLLKPNRLEIHDMSGNVYKWCEDQWHDDYNNAPIDGTAWVDREDNAFRVIRGGSWNRYSESCRVAFRIGYHPSGRGSGIGFRLVLSQSG